MRHSRAMMTVAASAIALIFQTAAAAAADRDIVFWPKNNCGASYFGQSMQSLERGFDSEVAIRADCTYGANCSNDTARSVMLGPTVKLGTIIRIWDDPTGSSKDDWTEIHVKNVTPNVEWSPGHMCIPSFEVARSGANYDTFYHRKNGLDGKVSRIEIIPAPAPARGHVTLKQKAAISKPK